MPIWEYKVITSGKGGFASPALLEKYLNDLGREEWEIIEFHSQTENFLAFTGLARRSTQRDWTLQDAAAAAAKAEAEKLRAEFEAKFKAATTTGPGGEERPPSFLEEKVAPDDGFRKPIDTSHDADADAEPDEKEEDDWDKLTAAEQDELPTFFEAIKPHMRRNQRGPGMSVGVDYLAKKWGQTEDDLKGALVECGFIMPVDEDSKAEYLEFEGDLFWVNVNRRGELWINTKEKPRPVFRAVKGQKVVVEEESKQPEAGRKHDGGRKHEEKPARHATPESEVAPAEAAEKSSPEAAAEPAARPAPSAPGEAAELPGGPVLLEKIRPLMRRNRRGPGGSGSASFLSRALKCRETDLVAAFKTLGLVVPTSANEKPTNVEIGNEVWWINMDSRGGIWINGRDKKPGETVGGPATEQAASSDAASGTPGQAESTESAKAEPAGATEPTAAPSAADTGSTNEPAATPATESSSAEGSAGVQQAPTGATGPLGQIRPLLKETRTGGFAAKVDRLAEDLGRPADDLTTALVAAGLVVPEKPREKPVFVEAGGEIFWFNRNAKGELWVNAKASKFAEKSGGDDAGEGEAATDEDGEKKSRRPRGRKKAE